MSAAVAPRRTLRAEVLHQHCVLQGTVLGGMYGHRTSRIHPRAEQKHQKLHTSTPLQSLPIALSRMSSKTFLCLNFEWGEENKLHCSEQLKEGAERVRGDWQLLFYFTSKLCLENWILVLRLRYLQGAWWKMWLLPILSSFSTLKCSVSLHKVSE